jgi:AraC-like DNA-binding protein
MTDRLAPLLAHFELQCRVLQAGSSSCAHDYQAQEGIGHLHLLRSGRLRWAGEDGQRHSLDRPGLLLYAGCCPHRLDTEEAEMVCATVAFGAQFGNPLLRGLPSPWVLPLDDLPLLGGLLELFFDEAFSERCGRTAVLDRMAELIVIQLLRLGFHQGLLQQGALAALAEPRLAKALTALHEAPGQAWTLERLAETAGMSRARFAAQFTEIVGTPPGDYLGGLRIGLAQRLLSRGRPLKAVAEAVGYGSANALSRAFQQRVGQTPSFWLAQRTA